MMNNLIFAAANNNLTLMPYDPNRAKQPGKH